MIQFFLDLLRRLVSWLIFPKKKRQKDDGGKSFRDNKTWKN